MPRSPTSRTNIWVNLEEFPSGSGHHALAATDVSAIIEVVNDMPIIVERAMYLNGQGRLFNAGHESAGVTAPSVDWFLAEGATGPYFDMFLLLANPGDTEAKVEATYLLGGGGTETRTYTIGAQSRKTIWVDLEGGNLGDAAVATRVRSTNGVPSSSSGPCGGQATSPPGMRDTTPRGRPRPERNGVWPKAS